MSYNVLLCDFWQFFCNLIDYAGNIIGEIRVQTEEICSMYCPKPCNIIPLLGLLYKENQGLNPPSPTCNNWIIKKDTWHVSVAYAYLGVVSLTTTWSHFGHGIILRVTVFINEVVVAFACCLGYQPLTLVPSSLDGCMQALESMVKAR